MPTCRVCATKYYYATYYDPPDDCRCGQTWHPMDNLNWLAWVAKQEYKLAMWCYKRGWWRIGDYLSVDADTHAAVANRMSLNN